MTTAKYKEEGRPDRERHRRHRSGKVRRKEAGDEVHRKVHKVIRETGKPYAEALDDVLANPDNAELLRHYAGVSHG